MPDPNGTPREHYPIGRHAAEGGKASGQARAAKARKEGRLPPPAPPFTSKTILDALSCWPAFAAESWRPWRTFLAGVFGLPMNADELAVYQHHTGRQGPQGAPYREAWALVGRRGGKSRIAALVACYLAGQDYSHVLSPGERGVVMCVAADRAQARLIYNYVVALLHAAPELERMIVTRRKESLDLSNGVTIAVSTASFRTVRGYTLLGVVCDEVAFWTSEGTANPDTEILNALRPGLLTVPGSLLLAISTVYSRKGATFAAFQKHYGQASDVLVWKGTTMEMNGTADAGLIARALEEDPAAAGAEYEANFRSDVEGFLQLEAVQAVTARGRRELPRMAGVRYVAFTDPSGGSQDSFTLAIAHQEKGVAVLDLIREVKPPFSPDSVVQDFAATLQAYGIREVTGDRYGGQWPQERFRLHGITYRESPATKSELYTALLPLVNAGRCALLDLPRLTSQLMGLERRTARSGKDSVDHAPGGRDDVANSAAGGLVAAVAGQRRASEWFTATIDHGGLTRQFGGASRCTCFNCRNQNGGECALTERA